MKEVIGYLLMIIGIAAGLYVGGWLMFIQPILEACRCFDAGILTGTIIGVTILKCVFSGAVGSIIAWLGVVLGSVVINS